ncbi:MAG: hypothetical protein ABH834_02590 [Candidatus Altiarchaeota archaeon]
MRPLTPEFKLEFDSLSERLASLSGELSHVKVDASSLRSMLSSGGFEIMQTECVPPGEGKSFLCADSSYGRLDARYHSIYCVHCVCLHAAYSESPKQDFLVGQGTINYDKLSYESIIDVGAMKPYSDVDARVNLIRLDAELSLLASSKASIGDADYLIVDGSLSTIKKELSSSKDYPEHAAASKAYDDLCALKAASMVEDSHATDVSSAIGLEITNLHLFDLALKPLEYIVKKEDGINTVYVKLPAKKVCYAPGERSVPFTVRWEFSYGGFEEDLASLVGAWALEDDLLHPQVYPMRIADYLTRRVKVNGILEEFALSNNLEGMYRARRTI